MKQISKTDFTSAVEGGSNKEELMTKFGMTASEVTKGLKMLNLKLKKKRKPTFAFVEELNNNA